jgi:hypothetical protein
MAETKRPAIYSAGGGAPLAVDFVDDNRILGITRRGYY